MQSTQEEKTPLLLVFCRSVLKNWPPSITKCQKISAAVADEEGVVYKEQIPEAIHALNQKAISLKGFMLPLKVEQGLVTEMLIMRINPCAVMALSPRSTNGWACAWLKKASNPSWMSL